MQFNKLKDRRSTIGRIMVGRSFESIALIERVSRTRCCQRCSHPSIIIRDVPLTRATVVVNSVLINSVLRGSLFPLPRLLTETLESTCRFHVMLHSSCSYGTRKKGRKEGRRGEEGFDFTTRRICHIAINDVCNHFCFAAS